MNKTVRIASIPAAAGLILGGALMAAPANASTTCAPATGFGSGTSSSAPAHSLGTSAGTANHSTGSSSGKADHGTSTDSDSGVLGVSDILGGNDSRESSGVNASDGGTAVSTNEEHRSDDDVTSFLNNLFGGEGALNSLGILNDSNTANGLIGDVNFDTPDVNVGDVANGTDVGGIGNGNDVKAPVQAPVASGNGVNAPVQAPVQAPVGNGADIDTWVNDTVDSTLDGITGNDGLLNNILGH